MDDFENTSFIADDPVDETKDKKEAESSSSGFKIKKRKKHEKRNYDSDEEGIPDQKLIVKKKPIPKKRKIEAQTKRTQIKGHIKKKVSRSKSTKRITAEEDGTKKKKKKRAKKPRTDFTQFSVQTKSSYYNTTKNHLVFSPTGEYSQKCDVVGVDIGQIHTAAVGVIGDFEKDIYPKVSWISLLSMPATAIHFSCDQLDSMLTEMEDFKWFRESKIHRIELQVGLNTGAKQIAQCIRTNARVVKMFANEESDVQYLHGNKKYDVGPKFVPKCNDDPIRQATRSGQENKSKRKQLAENDTKALLEWNGESKILKFLTVFADHADQMHDICDAYLIAVKGWDELRDAHLKKHTTKTIKPKRKSIKKAK